MAQKAGLVPRNGTDQYIVRFPNGMRERVRQSAIANRRSINSEIIVLLERALPAETKTATGAETPIAAE